MAAVDGSVTPHRARLVQPQPSLSARNQQSSILTLALNPPFKKNKVKKIQKKNQNSFYVVSKDVLSLQLVTEVDCLEMTIIWVKRSNHLCETFSFCLLST